ncbi:MAG: phosphoglycolate phosphatase [Gammaproteobacteria bacterium]|nr:phosphoglycolate phosphatase [Gammaproteobacteria bacterium]
MNTNPKAILFDLDGTLLDTAPDLCFALNALRKEFGLTEISLDEIKPFVGRGAKKMVSHVLGLAENDPDIMKLREKFLSLYDQNIAERTRFFPQMEQVINHLELNQIPWGIVTNKLTYHTHRLLKALDIFKRTACIICGDTLAHAKPHPLPILHACHLLKISPPDCLYVGDAATDVAASKAAGTHAIVALYGYLDGEDPHLWQADYYINEPLELLSWF